MLLFLSSLLFVVFCYLRHQFGCGHPVAKRHTSRHVCWTETNTSLGTDATKTLTKEQRDYDDESTEILKKL